MPPSARAPRAADVGSPGRGWSQHGAPIVLLLLLAVTILVRLLGTIVLPRLLAHNDRFPALAAMPTDTRSARGLAADPVNVAIVGSAAEVAGAFTRAQWKPADSLSRRSDLGIARSVLLNRPDSTAPVSSLYLFGRRQDLAFELQVGSSARHRHHVRLWQVSRLWYQGRPVWLGAATFDEAVGVSHRGLHPTHHIAPDVDAERDALEAMLAWAGQVQATFRETGPGLRSSALNAEGDRYETDGERRVIVLSPGNVPQPAPEDPGVPAGAALIERLWRRFH